MSQLPQLVEDQIAKLVDKSVSSGEYLVVCNWSTTNDILAVTMNRNGKFAASFQVAPFNAFAVGADWQSQILQSLLKFLTAHLPAGIIGNILGEILSHVSSLLASLALKQAIALAV